ncbi:hypothetical protein OG432_20495 [Streptomyces sp. NBC_00442]|uniref:hypothetical protein n=1 Tax=Streptomyces sp. NBC_00442 TaxID=2903651 RepID=UPI002E2421E0
MSDVHRDEEFLARALKRAADAAARHTIPEPGAHVAARGLRRRRRNLAALAACAVCLLAGSGAALGARLQEGAPVPPAATPTDGTPSTGQGSGPPSPVRDRGTPSAVPGTGTPSQGGDASQPVPPYGTPSASTPPVTPTGTRPGLPARGTLSGSPSPMFADRAGRNDSGTATPTTPAR